MRESRIIRLLLTCERVLDVWFIYTKCRTLTYKCIPDLVRDSLTTRRMYMNYEPTDNKDEEEITGHWHIQSTQLYKEDVFGSKPLQYES